MAAFNLLGLNKNFEIIQILRCTNVQWDRKYHEAGSFSLQLPLNQYDPDMEYVYTKDRPELGVVKSRNYISLSTGSYIQIKGFFLENEVDRMIVYQKGTTNITNSPTWEFQTGPAEDVATNYYNAFKKLTTADHSVELDFEALPSKHRGHYSEHFRNGESLAYKIYDILKPSGLSFRVEYNLQEDTKTFEVWGGLDRTQDNTDGNNPVIFSTKYGNVSKPNILIDETDYKNACVVIQESYATDKSTFDVQVAFNDDEGEDVRFVMQRASLNKNDYTAAKYAEALRQEGLNKLGDYIKQINLEFNAMAGSYEYMEDFDIGDLCSVEIADMQLTADVRLIGCYEVMKNGEWTMTMEFGTPMLT